MAFDQTTRNKLQRFVTTARNVLTEEFTRQLQKDFGIDPNTGEISPMEKLTLLDDAKRETARLLRETLGHYQAASPTTERHDLIDRIVREQAFTVLNRLCAVRMAEARGIIIESIGNGYNSKGFQLYHRLATTAMGEIGEAYRSYLWSVFDEFALDLPVLFDRFSAMGRLFPKPVILISGSPNQPGLIDLMNSEDLAPLWGEDETIGWIYQYFNSVEERRQMRDKSAAPRNSRELAVRNQFFTPRYVVEFLTDNTLGRIWYEMTQGQTGLTEACQYLLRRPNEIFLKPGEQAPAPERSTEELSQEELLQQSVYIPFRPLKDPREILMLDPACGSMHFGLYAFDLFERIYEEAWEWEGQSGKNILLRAKGLKPLQETYPTKEALLTDIPRLIIEYNIHGVDIDPRAVQIAGLSLWLRAQRSWKERDIKSTDRPQIRKSNIVCAEPMPGEKGFLDEFIAKHLEMTMEGKLMGQIVRRVFDAMQLAGEAGSLLKVEEEITDAIAEAKQRWLVKPKVVQGRLFADENPRFEQQQLGFDVSGITDEAFWENAEERIYTALRNYAEQAENGDGYQRRLFADDAARGFAFIDIYRRRYDVVVMNPPFGEFSKLWKDAAKNNYPYSYNDILGAFIEQFFGYLQNCGLIGAITSRTCFFLSSFKDWRRKVILEHSAIRIIADLGQGVMDDAMVEAAAYVLEATSPISETTFFRAIADYDRQAALKTCVSAYRLGQPELRIFVTNQENFGLLPDFPFVYWIKRDVIEKFMARPSFKDVVGDVRQGLATADNTRFARAIWEIPNSTSFSSKIKTWVPYILAGPSQPWYSPITLLVNWKNDAAELWSNLNSSGKVRSNIWMLRDTVRSYFFHPGFSWTRRAIRFIPYIIPEGCIPSASRYMAFVQYDQKDVAIGICASRLVSAFLRFYGEKFEWPNFLVSTVRYLPWPKIDKKEHEYFSSWIKNQVEQRRRAYQNHEPFHDFLLPWKICDFCQNGEALNFDQEHLLSEEGEKIVAVGYNFSTKEVETIEKDLSEALKFKKSSEVLVDEGVKVEDDTDFVLSFTPYAKEETHLSYLVGILFGRWDIRYATGEKQAPELPDPFAPLPVCPPGMLQNNQGLPITKEEVEKLKLEGNWNYPVEIPWDGILVNDPSHPLDIDTRLRQVLQIIWQDRWEDIEREASEILGVSALRDYFSKPTGFFADHLKRYSKSRRQAPIYWPLSTASGSYTLWIYYHRLIDQTLYICVNDFVEPKLQQVGNTVSQLRRKDHRNAQEEKELEKMVDFETELKDFQDELLRIAKFWKPNLNDGVQITASPLWKLFKLPKWQKTLKETWQKLEKGEYDWAHLVYSIWPERVIRKAYQDRSLAIAHNLESDLWEEKVTGTDRDGNPKTKWQPKQLTEAELKQLIRERTGNPA
jgi:hypothetical protein